MLRYYHNPLQRMAALVSITLLSRLHHAFLVASRPIRLLPRYSVHLGYNLLSEMVLEFMPCATHSRLMVRLRCRFIQAVAALSLIPSSVALLLMLIMGFRCVSCFLISAFYFHVRSPSIIVASACHHSVRLHSPALRPVFIQLAHTVFAEGEGIEPPSHC